MPLAKWNTRTPTAADAADKARIAELEKALLYADDFLMQRVMPNAPFMSFDYDELRNILVSAVAESLYHENR